MAFVQELRLIHLFDIYLVLIFVISSIRRIGQYRTVLALVASFPGRWPKVLQLAHKHMSIFVTWTMIRPLAVMLGLVLVQAVASYLFFSYAGLTVAHLPDAPIGAFLLAIFGLAMMAFDGFGAWRVGSVVDRAAVEKSLDQAEYWLRSWTAPVVHFFTLGRVNPRRMVTEEVRTALISASESASGAFNWLSIQTSLRFAFGLTLWITSALVTTNR